MVTLILALLGFSVVFLVAIFVLFPQSRRLGSAFMGLIFDNVAATPEGAEAIYSDKIQEARERRGRAKESYNLAAGRYSSTNEDILKLKAELERTEKQCENLYKSGNRGESLMVLAEKRESILQEIKDKTDMLCKYEEAVKQTQNIFEEMDRCVRKLEQEKSTVVRRMKDNKDIKELFDQVDELNGEGSSDRLLNAIKEKDKELSEMATGAQVVHQSKMSTKLQIAEKEAYKQETFDYIKSLEAKYGTKKPQLRD